MAPRKPAAKRGKAGKAVKAPGRSAARRSTSTARRPTKAAAPPKPALGAVAHVELYSHDPAGTQRFFSQVFGWTFRDVSYGPGMTYTMFEAPGAPHGGMMPRQAAPESIPATLVYLNVKDLDQTVRKVEDAGGKVLLRHEVPNVGWFAVFEAPGGIVQAAWQTNPAMAPQS